MISIYLDYDCMFWRFVIPVFLAMYMQPSVRYTRVELVVVVLKLTLYCGRTFKY